MEQVTENALNTVQHVRLIFALIIMASFLDIIDFSIVQVALPTIRTQFLATYADLQWVIGAYGLTLAGFLMLMGRAGDVYGQKKIFIGGIALFTIASFAGGLAPSLLVLIIFRALQGIGAAMSTVTAFAIFIRIFPEGPQRNRALGVLVAVLSAGFAAGAVAGGALTVGFGWRSVMFVNVPIGIVAALLSQRYLPKTEGWLKGQRLDVPGAITVTLGTILLVFGLTNASTPAGFSALDTIVPLSLSALTLVSFLVIESRSKSPLIPMEFLKRRSVLNANTLALVLTSTVGGVSFIITIYLQNILGYSALYAGLGTLPSALIFFVVGGWGGPRIMGRLGARRTLLISTALATVGIALLTLISVQGSYFVILPGMIVWTLGASIGFPAVNLAAVAGTKPGEEGLASGVISTSFRIGFPLGLAVLLTVAGAFDPPASADVGSSDALAGVVAGFRYALFAAVLLSLLGIALASRIKDVKPPWQK
ncbi:MAG TPA: MFS transporter [Candidatus Angelobacter sp.]|nr:MFS transporter [Candidatus Angelobacter sp.]